MQTQALLQGLRAAGESTRLRLLFLCSLSELTVSELVQILGQSQPRISRHLKLLVEANLLDRFREGAWAFYCPTRSGHGAKIVKILVGLVSESDPVIAADLIRLKEIKQKRQERSNAYFKKNALIWSDLRSLYVPEEDVEKELIQIFSKVNINDFLDIGTGTGRILQLMSSHIKNGIGLDQSLEMINIARTNLESENFSHCQVRHGDMYRLPFSLASFDAISIHQVLHFADNPGLVIKEAANVLRPEGLIVVIDFAPHSLESLRDTQAHRRLGFGSEEVKGWFNSAGLIPGQVTTLFGDPLTVCIWMAKSSQKKNKIQ